ncbi:MAG TPA: cell division protein FtsQ/DivIB [Acetobacteraceae bacterium]|nr:cell division protein FtsQ/DivIB [Acetobacteraceae bacterium]
MPRVKKPRAPVRPQVQDRPGRWQVLLRRQRRLLAPALGGSLLILALGAGVSALHIVGRGASFSERVGDATAGLGLRVENVVVEGRVKTPEPLLRAAIGIAPGEPILSYSVQAARARIESINWVHDATVERRLPDTIFVHLVERRPFAVWQHEGKFRLIDRDGQVVTDSDVADFASQLPLVVGAGANASAGTGKPSVAALLLDALATQPAIQGRVTAAVRVGERRWNLRLNNGIDVLLPEGAETQALAKLAQLQAQHQLLDRPMQAIDMRLPDRFVFRPQIHDMPSKDAQPARRPT